MLTSGARTEPMIWTVWPLLVCFKAVRSLYAFKSEVWVVEEKHVPFYDPVYCYGLGSNHVEHRQPSCSIYPSFLPPSHGYCPPEGPLPRFSTLQPPFCDDSVYSFRLLLNEFTKNLPKIYEHFLLFLPCLSLCKFPPSPFPLL